jgi:hypothetical protein
VLSLLVNRLRPRAPRSHNAKRVVPGPVGPVAFQRHGQRRVAGRLALSRRTHREGSGVSPPGENAKTDVGILNS